MNKHDVILCRCEDVSLQDLHNVLDEGYTTFEDVKRILRVGMGPCQGNTCSLLVQREIAQYLGKPLAEVDTHKARPLAMGVTLGAIAKRAKHED